jgi:hypothetical protein
MYACVLKIGRARVYLCFHIFASYVICVCVNVSVYISCLGVTREFKSVCVFVRCIHAFVYVLCFYLFACVYVCVWCGF